MKPSLGDTQCLVSPDPFQLVSLLCSLFLRPFSILESVVCLKHRIHHVQLLLNTPILVALFAFMLIFILIHSKWTCPLFSSHPSSPAPDPYSRPWPNQTQHHVSKTESLYSPSSTSWIAPSPVLTISGISTYTYLVVDPGVILDPSSPSNPTFYLRCLSRIIS